MKKPSKTVLILALVAVLIIGGGLVACLRGAGSGAAVEVEDCDAEDYRNRERECGFSDADRRKLKQPTVKQPTKKRP